MSRVFLPRRCGRALFCAAVECLLVLCVMGTQSVAPKAWAVELKAELVVDTGLVNPVFGAAPAGQSGVLYISEQNNVAIKVLDLQTKQLTTFLDLPNISGAQNGLSAFAFHPDYANNGKFYLNIFDTTDSRVKIVEYQRSIEDPLQADPASRREIYSFENLSGSHNGGWLGFSPIDGYLYVATGDGGAVGGPLNGLSAQDVLSPKGKILRLSVDVDDYPFDETQNFGVPGTNPFVVDGVIRDAYAIGLRHPFRASFDRLSGDLYIGDVGSNRFEEVNLLPANSGGGENFGWRTKEGPYDQPGYSDPIPEGVIDPLYYYDHGDAAAVIGGYVYRGSSISGFEGHYIYADAVTDSFVSFRYDGTTAQDIVDRSTQLARPMNPNSYGQIASFAEDAQGELYFFDRTAGDVYKIVAGAPDPIAGDFDTDGDVDGDDLVIWQQAYGTDNLGDADADGDSDGQDFLTWQRNLTAEPTPVLSDVPEPTTCSLLLLASTIVFKRAKTCWPA